MIPYLEAIKIIEEETKNRRPPTEDVEISQSVGRYLAQDISAPLSLQPFDNAAMDGYALRSTDTQGASDKSPVFIGVKGVIAAGCQEEQFPLAPCESYKIMTGAPVPSEADTIIPVEEARLEDGRLIIHAPLSPGSHIRLAGADIKKGDVMLRQGDRISSTDLLPLASLGLPTVNVKKSLRFAFISTGDEVVDDLSKPLEKWEIYNSNQVYAVSYLEQLGAVCRQKISLKDNTQTFKQKLQQIIADDEVDFVVSSGAVSAGDFDFIKNGLLELGAKILFHKVKIKPGKPVLFAVLPNGAFYFGLPGNPAATAAGLRFFVTPALLSWMGTSPEQPMSIRLGGRLSKNNELRLFLKAIVKNSPQGEFDVVATDGQESFRVYPFFSMNGWLVVPEDKKELKVGDLVNVYPEWPDTRGPRQRRG